MSALGILAFALMILFSIGLHEAGHFSTAKAFDIKVDRFFIGFGPRIWSWRRGETEYGVAALPLGGYVRIAGMNPFEEVPESERSRTFGAKPAWQRAIVLVAGSATHFLIAFLVYAAIMAFVGLPERVTTTVAAVSPSTTSLVSPAAVAKFRAGDRIVAIDGKSMASWDEVRSYIRAHPGKSVTFGVARGGGTVTLTAVLAKATPDGEKVGYLGIEPEIANVTRPVVSALSQSGISLATTSWASLKALGNVFSPSTLHRLFSVAVGNRPRSLNDPTTIVGAGRVAGQLASRHDYLDIVLLFVGFNVFVGVANLLPLPPLDGGHLAILGYEQIRRRKVDARKIVPVTAVVVSVLVALFLLLLYLDLVRPLTLPG